MSKVVILVGPTAVGKTDISIDIAKAVDGEIISSDSMQIYKHFDIGSAKPTKEEMQGVPHYLIDEIDPFVNFSVSDYQEKAKAYIKDISSRGKTPIVTGGTGLYVNALMYDMDFSNSASDPDYRKELEAIAEAHGNQHVHEMLKDIDPKSYQKIHFNNLRKVIRALEVYHVTGQTIDDFSTDLKKTSDYDYVLIGLTRNRKRLYVRINKRVDIMIDQGLIDEVKNLREMGLNASNTSMQGIGYKEVVPYLDGMYDKETMISLIKQNSRRYAKRQMTWFRRYDDIHWFDYDQYDTYEEMKAAIIRLIKS
ncbi:tRNA (adenosine(37)-N6)-dimethylallyltransferase MiaA [Acidaminobacter sp. JC074]|uniref:tRNA (adenosine(37)-N6)-dimethylallyltransferase MiaA n=1 Tax=Acidaminobacter sp. JC074 TaxID=2530199 RepID=UPI001F0E500A|nr:tRNA (adenosine(37)-N6)-dimethylallyltransferase MiaA [Acidaminobacter sp. JC074]MCH4888876.1 tRNA (adenosine(37)-N6)-dimethylallyltransferase MiaA [Acidaminobacter sp. JC074]